MDKKPLQLDALAAAHGGLDDFRITSQAEILGVLRSLVEGSVPINLNASDGTVYTTTLWSIDPVRGTLAFSADEHSMQVEQLVEADETVAVAYLDSIKLQFDVRGLMRVHAGKSSALSCALPGVLYRFQRRAGYRVRPPLRDAPVARMRHPMIPDMALALRVLDVSIGGCALFLPDDVPPLQPGVVVNGVQLALDVDTVLDTALRLQHVTSLNPEARGVRLGCELVAPSAETVRTLERYIGQTQRRLRVLGG